MKLNLYKHPLFLLFLLLFGCSLSRQAEEEKYCDNQIRLIANKEDNPVLRMDYKQDRDGVISQIESLFQEDICWKTVGFGLKLGNERIIPIKLFNECGGSDIQYHRKFPEVQIRINEKGKVLVETEIMQIDSVKYWIGENYPNKNERNLEEISIQWLKETPKDSIERVFENILEGYLISYETVSQENFNKPVCDLSKSQIDSLKEMLSFNVSLGFGYVAEPIRIPSDNP